MKIKALLVLSALLVSASSFSQKSSIKAINATDIKTHMKYLSSDDLQGRKTGSEGNLKAADYISAEAMKMGLKPLPGKSDLFQTLNFLKTEVCADSSYIIFRDSSGNTLSNVDFTPLVVPSSRVDISGEVVFAGYGYMYHKTKYSDYQGLSFKDKIVIVMSRTPDLAGDGMPAQDEGIDDMAELKKLTPLFMQGPRAILFVADPAYGDKPLNLMISESYKLTPLFRKPMFDVNRYVIRLRPLTSELVT